MCATDILRHSAFPLQSETFLGSGGRLSPAGPQRFPDVCSINASKFAAARPRRRRSKVWLAHCCRRAGGMTLNSVQHNANLDFVYCSQLDLNPRRVMIVPAASIRYQRRLELLAPAISIVKDFFWLKYSLFFPLANEQRVAGPMSTWYTDVTRSRSTSMWILSQLDGAMVDFWCLC